MPDSTRLLEVAVENVDVRAMADMMGVISEGGGMRWKLVVKNVLG